MEESEHLEVKQMARVKCKGRVLVLHEVDKIFSKAPHVGTDFFLKKYLFLSACSVVSSKTIFVSIKLFYYY